MRARWIYFLLNCKFSRVRLEQILRGNTIADLQLPVVSDHCETATLYEHLVIATLVRVLKPLHCFEIGTSLGLTSSSLAANLPPDGRLETLDLSDEPRIGAFFRERPEALKIRQHFGSSSEFCFEPFHGKMDLVLVDGSHEFEQAQRDTRNAFQMLSPTGVILWHDVNPNTPGVLKALQNCEKADRVVVIADTSFGFYSARESLMASSPSLESVWSRELFRRLCLVLYPAIIIVN